MGGGHAARHLRAATGKRNRQFLGRCRMSACGHVRFILSHRISIEKRSGLPHLFTTPACMGAQGQQWRGRL